MKRFALTMLMSAMLGTAWAGESVDKTLDVKPDGLVQIENVRGHIEVKGWDKNEVSVKGTLDDDTEKFVFETSGATTTVKVVLPHHLDSDGGRKGSDLVIQVPTMSRVRTEFVSTDLTIAGIHGGVDGHTVSGNIVANDLRKRIELGSVSGDITLDDSEGGIDIGTVSGDIKAKVDTDSVKINTVSGDGRIESGQKVKDLRLSTVSGDMEVRADLADGARVEGSTVSGDLRLLVNSDINAVVDMSTAAGGEVINGLSDHQPKRGMIGNEKLQFTLGSGKGEIDLNSVSGTLELRPR